MTQGVFTDMMDEPAVGSHVVRPEEDLLTPEAGNEMLGGLFLASARTRLAVAIAVSLALWAGCFWVVGS